MTVMFFRLATEPETTVRWLVDDFMANLVRIPDHRRRVYRLASLLAFLPAGNARPMIGSSVRRPPNIQIVRCTWTTRTARSRATVSWRSAFHCLTWQPSASTAANGCRLQWPAGRSHTEVAHGPHQSNDSRGRGEGAWP